MGVGMPGPRNCRRRNVAGGVPVTSRTSGGALVLAVMTALMAAPFSVSPAGAAPGTMSRVNVAADGTQADDHSNGRAVSADGRFVVFESSSSILVANDTNGRPDVFLRDRQAGTTTRVNVASDGTQADSDAFGAEPDISADGRHVVFASTATNLVPGDTNGVQDIFVHDNQTGATTRVSTSAAGVQTTQRSDRPSISADGRYVVFQTGAAELVADDTNFQDDVFVHDRQTGSVTRANLSNLDGPNRQALGGGSRLADVSGDGRYVAFSSSAVNLVAGDTNGEDDVFVHDRQTGTTTRVSLATDGSQNMGESGGPAISGNGRFVAFLTRQADPLNSGGSINEVFVHDRQTGATTKESVSSNFIPTSQSVDRPVISADGRFVAFATSDPGLVPGDTNNRYDVFLRDRLTRTTTRESVADDGSQADGVSGVDDITGDGRHLLLTSSATNFVPGDTNGQADVFVRTLDHPPLVSVGDVAVHEGDAGTRAAVFTVSLSSPSAATVTVAYATANGSALKSGDYAVTKGTLSFAPGATNATVKVPVAGDTTDEVDETFTLALSAPVQALISDATGLATILDDDPGTGKRLAIGDVSVHEGDSGSRAAVFTVSLSSPSASTVTVAFTTADGTAAAPADYATRSGTVTFAPGATSATVKVPVLPDGASEGNETFTIVLSGSSGPAIVDTTGVGIIVDND